MVIYNKYCLECGKPLKGKQQKWCSLKCKKAVKNRKYNLKNPRKEYKRNKAKEWREKWKKMGICPRCGKNPRLDFTIVCESCWEYIQLYK